MWLLTLGSVPGSMADLVISMGLFVDLDLNDIRLLPAQLLCQQTQIW